MQYQIFRRFFFIYIDTFKIVYSTNWQIKQTTYYAITNLVTGVSIMRDSLRHIGLVTYGYELRGFCVDSGKLN